MYAMYPDADSYESLVWVCRKLGLPERACEEVFRRMVFNILTNNTDDHKKNFSFIMGKDGKWRLAPNYDVTFIFNIGGHQAEVGQSLSVRGKSRGISMADITAFAKDNGIRYPHIIINDVVNAVNQFLVLVETYGIKKDKTHAIASCLSENLKAWGYQPLISSPSFQLDGHDVRDVK